MQLQWPNYAYIFIAHVNLMLHSGLENFTALTIVLLIKLRNIMQCPRRGSHQTQPLVNRACIDACIATYFKQSRMNQQNTPFYIQSVVIYACAYGCVASVGSCFCIRLDHVTVSFNYQQYQYMGSRQRKGTYSAYFF